MCLLCRNLDLIFCFFFMVIMFALCWSLVVHLHNGRWQFDCLQLEKQVILYSLSCQVTLTHDTKSSLAMWRHLYYQLLWCLCNLCWIRNTLPAGNGFQCCTMRFSLSRQTENELQSHSCFSPPLSPLPLPFSSPSPTLACSPQASSSFLVFLLLFDRNLKFIPYFITWNREIASLLFILAKGEPQGINFLT